MKIEVLYPEIANLYGDLENILIYENPIRRSKSWKRI